MEFKDRKGSHLNRKILNIISQTPTQMVVDVKRDNTGICEEGTPINAEVFNNFQTEITVAFSTANEAKETSNVASTISQNAKDVADEAKNIASQANTNSDNAITTSNEAKNLANSANTSSNTAVSIANEAKTESSSVKAMASEAKTLANNAKSIVEGIEGQIPTKTSQLTNDSSFVTEEMLNSKIEPENIIAGSNIELTKNGKNVTINALSSGAGSITLNGTVTTNPRFFAPTSGGSTGYRDIYSENELPSIGSSVSGTNGEYVLVNGNGTVDSISYDEECEYWTYNYSSKTPIWKKISTNTRGYNFLNIYGNSTGVSSGTISWSGGQQYSMMTNIFIITTKQGTTGYRTFVVNCDNASSTTPYCIYGSSSSYYIKFYFSSYREITITASNGMTITRVMQLYPNTFGCL